MTIQHLFSYSFVVVHRRLYSWVHPHAFQMQSLFQNIMDTSRKLNKNTNLAAKIRCLYSVLRGCVASRDIRQNSSVSQQQGSWLHRVIQGPRHFSVWGSAVFLGILLFDDQSVDETETVWRSQTRSYVLQPKGIRHDHGSGPLARTSSLACVKVGGLEKDDHFLQCTQGEGNADIREPWKNQPQR